MADQSNVFTFYLSIYFFFFFALVLTRLLLKIIGYILYIHVLLCVDDTSLKKTKKTLNAVVIT